MVIVELICNKGECDGKMMAVDIFPESSNCEKRVYCTKCELSTLSEYVDGNSALVYVDDGIYKERDIRIVKFNYKLNEYVPIERRKFSKSKDLEYTHCSRCEKVIHLVLTNQNIKKSRVCEECSMKLEKAGVVGLKKGMIYLEFYGKSYKYKGISNN